MKEKGKLALKDWQSLWLVDINYNFECDLLIELSDTKLSDNKLASELVENKSFLKPITIEKIVIFMIMKIKITLKFQHTIAQGFNCF